MTAKAARNSRSKTSVSLTLAAVTTQATGTPSAIDRDVVLGAPLGAVGWIGTGEIAAALGPH